MTTLSTIRRDYLVNSVHFAVRLVVGGLFACHGAASIFGVFSSGIGSHVSTVRFGAWPGWWAALIELVGGILVAAGLFTRVIAVLCSGSMAYAYFTVHQQHGLLPIQNGGEPAAMFCWTFLLIAAIGSGPIALDALLRRRGRRQISKTSTSIA